MNETTLLQLKTIVERAVRPVRAPLARKRKMREELLRHLLEVYDEELQKKNNESVALSAATERFGDPIELRQELQASIHFWNRPYFEGLKWQPGESLLHFVGKTVLVTAGWYSCFLVFGFIVFLFTAKELTFIARISLFLIIMAVFSIVCSVFSVYFPIGIAQTLYGQPAKRSKSKTILFVLGSLMLYPVSIAFVCWMLPIDREATEVAILAACCFAPLPTLSWILLARRKADEMRHDEEWASLAID